MNAKAGCLPFLRRRYLLYLLELKSSASREDLSDRLGDRFEDGLCEPEVEREMSRA